MWIHMTLTVKLTLTQHHFRGFTWQYVPLAGQARKTWPEYLSGALRWAHRAPGEAVRTDTCECNCIRVSYTTCTVWRTGLCMKMYLQHVTQHVHALENGEPKLRNASWIFHWHGFLFFRILNRSLFLYLRLRVKSTPGNLTIRIKFIMNEISGDIGWRFLWWGFWW